jgi:PadR family transcriptional regulator, regulatory protein PadR
MVIVWTAKLLNGLGSGVCGSAMPSSRARPGQVALTVTANMAEAPMASVARVQVNPLRCRAQPRCSHRGGVPSPPFLCDLGKITRVAIIRMTKATRDVLSVLLDAHSGDLPIYGWEIKRRTRRSGPTVYGVLDRLEDDSFIVGEWEQQAGDATGPRRRFYTLTSDGVGLAEAVLGRLAANSPSEPPASRPVLRRVV